MTALRELAAATAVDPKMAERLAEKTAVTDLSHPSLTKRLREAVIATALDINNGMVGDARQQLAAALLVIAAFDDEKAALT